ncbi:MAG TPA: patatin-like phospholipase family protein, partial [Patescibacteria group bacterium]|nr:patatin-like phospholipase family protein [Patescibacteria group bacterium]
MPAANPVKVALAVQGGGAHGAFSWGVLDALLDDAKAGNIAITALSGTSAGAFNASVAAYGLGMFPDDIAKAADHAKALLREFWMGDASLAAFSIYTTTAALTHAVTGSWNID